MLVSARVVFFYIRHSASLNGVYFSAEYCSVEPTAESMLASRVPPTHSIISLFSDLEPFRVQGQTPFKIHFKPVLPFTLVKDLAVTGLWYAYFGTNLSVPVCKMGSCSKSQDCQA